MAPWGRSRCDRAIFGAAHQFGCGSRSVDHSSALELPYLHKTKKVRQRRFRTLVLIGSIRMQPIRAAARLGIDQRCPQVVFAQEPIERAHRPCRPLRAAIRPPRSKAGGNRCCRLDGLLIERFRLLAGPAEALGPDRSEASRRRGLKRHEPAQRLQAGLDVGWRVGRSGPFGSAPGEGARCRKRARLRTRASLWFSLPRASTSTCRPEARACGWRRGLRRPARNRRPTPGARRPRPAETRTPRRREAPS